MVHNDGPRRKLFLDATTLVRGYVIKTLFLWNVGGEVKNRRLRGSRRGRLQSAPVTVVQHWLAMKKVIIAPFEQLWEQLLVHVSVVVCAVCWAV